ncbi:hypothetical protein CHS0354_015469 [Potamilus streckersoni]|uniref:Uncharacterized protein n=1 Tax=Potamilus streckersoni TaxID=2493646 RepID=A0AAE0VHB8_9BIVA|nr:hypothetical protein CHS0354_015469 [Potamilus streckersoni]
MDMKILFLVLSASLVCSQVPPAQNGQGQNACAQAGRNAVSRCFQSNGGFQMQNVIAVLSNGSQGSLPPNSDQVRKGICQGQSPIISCVFTSVNSLRTSDQCPSRNDFIRLEQETVGLITGLQTMCGSGKFCFA